MNPFPTDDIVSRFKMFWQYPVITEKTFYEQNKNNNNCLSFPWATVIDKNYRNDVIYNILKKYIHPGRQYYTCCQHISFRNLIPLFKSLGIQTVYTPHKMIGENVLSDIQLRPCPLYAVNVEDPHRNTTFKNVELLNVERKLLYSFQGAYIPRIYLTDIREKIFNMKHPDKCFVHNTGQWHFERIVYNKLQNKDYMLNENDSDKERTEKYNRLLLESRYSLCPSGSGPNSIRFWESLACGSIPVLLSDGLELPSHELWDESIVRVSERELHTLPMLLSNIDIEKENRMRENCIKLYEYYTTNYANRKSKNMIVFGNCHGARYMDIFKRDTNINNLFNINYIVSYQQLDNFSNFKDEFSDADVLIINNIKNYDNYTLKNLKLILKSSCVIVVIPFVRFDGYWLPEPYKRLNYVSENAVSFFPSIERETISDYLISCDDKERILQHFNNALVKLKQIDHESDIRFYDFFIENHRKYPFFRDNHHPTMNMLEHIGAEIIKKLILNFDDICYNDSYFQLHGNLCEWGHYKPIKDIIKSTLNIEYDLDKVFLCSRKKYLETILTNELNQIEIKDLDHLRKMYFT